MRNEKKVTTMSGNRLPTGKSLVASHRPPAAYFRCQLGLPVDDLPRRNMVAGMRSFIISCRYLEDIWSLSVSSAAFVSSNLLHDRITCYTNNDWMILIRSQPWSQRVVFIHFYLFMKRNDYFIFQRHDMKTKPLCGIVVLSGETVQKSFTINLRASVGALVPKSVRELEL